MYMGKCAQNYYSALFGFSYFFIFIFSHSNIIILLYNILQVLQSLDVLRKAPKQTMSDLQSPECLGSLHTLYSMTLTPIGQLQTL